MRYYYRNISLAGNIIVLRNQVHFSKTPAQRYFSIFYQVPRKSHIFVLSNVSQELKHRRNLDMAARYITDHLMPVKEATDGNTT
jgi:hypothetical protein